MSSTYLNIRKIKNIKSYRRRLSHNLRLKNLKSGPAANENYININGVDDRENIKKYLLENEKPVQLITKTILSKQISRLNNRLKNSKKELTKEKLEKDIKELKKQRDDTKAISTANDAQIFYELDMSITSIKDKKLLRNKYFLGAQLEIYEQWLKEKLPNAKIIVLAGHLDQANPHAHVNLMYVGGESLTNDLNNSFGESPHYAKMQKDFHKFVKEHILLKEYKLKLVGINENGKKNYIPAAKYKLLQDRAKQQATKAVNTYVDKLKSENKKMLGFDTDVIIKKLQYALINENSKSIELSGIPKFFQELENDNKRFEIENEKILNENDQLKKDNVEMLKYINEHKILQEKLKKTNQSKDKSLNKSTNPNNHISIGSSCGDIGK